MLLPFFLEIKLEVFYGCLQSSFGDLQFVDLCFEKGDFIAGVLDFSEDSWWEWLGSEEDGF